MLTLDEVADILMKMFGDEPPCNINGMDACCDDWREKYCDKPNYKECWKHAIENGWYKNES